MKPALIFVTMNAEDAEAMGTPLHRTDAVRPHCRDVTDVHVKRAYALKTRFVVTMPGIPRVSRCASTNVEDALKQLFRMAVPQFWGVTDVLARPVSRPVLPTAWDDVCVDLCTQIVVDAMAAIGERWSNRLRRSESAGL